ncbi:MAG: hypothetical protein OHK0046_42220 [Anaerolineae bacterium]
MNSDTSAARQRQPLERIRGLGEGDHSLSTPLVRDAESQRNVFEGVAALIGLDNALIALGFGSMFDDGGGR